MRLITSLTNQLLYNIFLYIKYKDYYNKIYRNLFIYSDYGKEFEFGDPLVMNGIEIV